MALFAESLGATLSSKVPFDPSQVKEGRSNMSEPTTQSKKLQWKWIGISIVLYAVFYLLPLMLFTLGGGVIASIWVFAGIIVVAAVAGYWSEGVTIWEPAIAGAGLMLLFLIAMIAFIPRQISILNATIGMVIVAAMVFLLSLLGAWLGERAQKLWKSKPAEPAQQQ